MGVGSSGEHKLTAKKRVKKKKKNLEHNAMRSRQTVRAVVSALYFDRDDLNLLNNRRLLFFYYLKIVCNSATLRGKTETFW